MIASREANPTLTPDPNVTATYEPGPIYHVKCRTCSYGARMCSSTAAFQDAYEHATMASHREGRKHIVDATRHMWDDGVSG